MFSYISKYADGGLIDTEAMREDLKIDPRFYKKGNYTSSGRKRLAAIEQIASNQDKGYSYDVDSESQTFKITDASGQRVEDTPGRGMSVDEGGPFYGMLSRDKSAKKEISRTITAATTGKYFKKLVPKKGKESNEDSPKNTKQEGILVDAEEVKTTVNKGKLVDKKPSKEEIEQSRMTTITSLLGQGITDKTQLLEYLNYDDKGNLVGDWTADEVQSYLDKYNTKTPESASSKKEIDPQVQYYMDKYGMSEEEVLNNIKEYESKERKSYNKKELEIEERLKNKKDNTGTFGTTHDASGSAFSMDKVPVVRKNLLKQIEDLNTEIISNSNDKKLTLSQRAFNEKALRNNKADLKRVLEVLDTAEKAGKFDYNPDTPEAKIAKLTNKRKSLYENNKISIDERNMLVDKLNTEIFKIKKGEKDIVVNKIIKVREKLLNKKLKAKQDWQADKLDWVQYNSVLNDIYQQFDVIDTYRKNKDIDFEDIGTTRRNFRSNKKFENGGRLVAKGQYGLNTTSLYNASEYAIKLAEEEEKRKREEEFKKDPTLTLNYVDRLKTKGLELTPDYMSQFEEKYEPSNKSGLVAKDTTKESGYTFGDDQKTADSKKRKKKEKLTKEESTEENIPGLKNKSGFGASGTGINTPIGEVQWNDIAQFGLMLRAKNAKVAEVDTPLETYVPHGSRFVRAEGDMDAAMLNARLKNIASIRGGYMGSDPVMEALFNQMAYKKKQEAKGQLIAERSEIRRSEKQRVDEQLEQKRQQAADDLQQSEAVVNRNRLREYEADLRKAEAETKKESEFWQNLGGLFSSMQQRMNVAADKRKTLKTALIAKQDERGYQALRDELKELRTKRYYLQYDEKDTSGIDTEIENKLKEIRGYGLDVDRDMNIVKNIERGG